MKPWSLESVSDAHSRRAREGQRLRARAVAFAVAAALAGAASACQVPESERLTCDDVYPRGQFDYRALELLIAQDELGGKGCMAAPCHTAQTQRGGLRLDTPELIYEEMSTRPEDFYGTLASGYMPHDGEAWSDEELKIFRSWYCAGAFPP